MAPPCKKQKFLSLDDKVRILADVASEQKGDIVEKLGIPPSSLSTILKSKEAIAQTLALGTSAKRKKLTLSAHEVLDKAKYMWFVETRMMAAAWAATRRPVIANCFTHAGFKLGDLDTDSAEDPADCNGAVHPPTDLIASWAALQGAGNVPFGVELDDFIDADIDVITYEELSDEDIIKSVSDDRQSDDDEVPDLHPPPATSRVLDAFDVVINCVAVHDDDVAMQLLVECENCVVMLLGRKGKQSTGTSRMFPQTVSGAYMSGLREAWNILRRLPLGLEPDLMLDV
ncbi:hypothetical protein HPB49_003526 [Dermacentor silvarum]|uniref:Uncharacterized protein n=1 Tax=Dermacentor silvarum TaxID=543639 RepID=A0ACB8DTU8_DERSI|nr:hypothetical protein HPB49_003526 [Dermacentor silvarum]